MTTKVSSSLLADTTVTAGTYGGSTKIPYFAVDAQGRLTAAGNTNPSIANTQITGLITTNQIASVSNTQITGLITTNQIASVSNTQITGLITGTQLDLTNATAITQVVGDKSTKLATTAFASQVANSGSYTKQIIRNAKTSGGACLLINNKVFISGAVAEAQLGKNGSQSNRMNFTEIPFKDAHLIPSNATITEVACVGQSVYALFSNGWVYSFGINSYGQLGHGDTINRKYFTRIEYFVTNNITVNKIWTNTEYYADTTYGRLFARGTNGNLYACGYNGYGELGIGNTTQTISTPTIVSGITNVTMLSSGVGAYGHTLAVSSNDPTKLYAWGYGGNGQLGNGGTGNLSSPTVVYTATGLTYSQIIANSSSYFTSSWSGTGCSYILLSNGLLYSTGYNGYGQLGVGDTTQRTSFTATTLTGGIISRIEAMDGYVGSVYAITTSGALYAAGYNGYGQLGDGTTTNRPSFTLIISSGVSSVDCAGFSAYASMIVKLTTGELKSCGYNGSGSLGNGDTAFSGTNYLATVPRPRGNVVDYKLIYGIGSRYDSMMLVLMDDGNLYACGNNYYGALGIPEDTTGYNTAVLTQVPLIYK